LHVEGNVEAGASVEASACYPSQRAEESRDRSQQWLVGEDATVRPFANQSLCMTTGDPQV